MRIIFVEGLPFAIKVTTTSSSPLWYPFLMIYAHYVHITDATILHPPKLKYPDFYHSPVKF